MFSTSLSFFWIVLQIIGQRIGECESAASGEPAGLCSREACAHARTHSAPMGARVLNVEGICR